MRQVYVRRYNPATDKKLLLEWLYSGRKENRFDPEIFIKNQVEVYTAFTDEEIVGFIPLTRAYLVESLAFRPGLERVVEGRALQAFQHVLVDRASAENTPDAFFFTLDQSLLKFVEPYGWSTPDVPMRHLHFSSLEPKKDEDTNKS